MNEASRTQDSAFLASMRPLFMYRALAIAAWVGGFGVIILGRGGIASTWLALAGIAGSIVGSIAHLLLNLTIKQRAWQRFFEIYGLERLPENTAPFEDGVPLLGVMGKLGIKRNATTEFHTNLQGQHARLMELYVEFDKPAQGRKQAPTRATYRVFEIRTPTNFHHVFIDSKRNHIPLIPTAMGLLHDSVRINEKLVVEGDMNRYFNIYVPAGTMSNGLITLTPDRLLALREYGKAFDIEFVGQSIYVITRNSIRSSRDIMMYQAGIVELVLELGRSLRANHAAGNQELKVNPKPQNIIG